MAKRIDQKTINFIIDKYINNKKSMHFIAKKINRDTKTIARILKINNIQIRSKKEQLNQNNLILDNEKKNICNSYLLKKTLKEVGILFGRDPKIIRRILSENNIKIKTIAEQNTQFTNESVFENIDTHEKAYWLGFLAADGNISKKGQLRLQLAEKDLNHLKKFYNFMGGQSKIVKCITNLNKKKYIGYRVNFTSSKLRNDLIKHNIVPNKSLTLQLSNYITEQYFASYILGIFDGDGTIGFYNNRLQFGILSSLYACEQIQTFLMKNCGVNKTKIIKCGKIYSVGYCGNLNTDKIMKVLYENATIFLERKRNIYNNYLIFKYKRGY